MVIDVSAVSDILVGGVESLLLVNMSISFLTPTANRREGPNSYWLPGPCPQRCGEHIMKNVMVA